MSLLPRSTSPLSLSPPVSLVPRVIKRLLWRLSLCLPPFFCSPPLPYPAVTFSCRPFPPGVHTVVRLLTCTVALPVCLSSLALCVCNKLVGKNISPFCLRALSLVRCTTELKLPTPFHPYPFLPLEVLSPTLHFLIYFFCLISSSPFSTLVLVSLLHICPARPVIQCPSVFCPSLCLCLHQMLQQYGICASLHCRMLRGAWDSEPRCECLCVYCIGFILARCSAAISCTSCILYCSCVVVCLIFHVNILNI